jgi:2-polyprenyl-3-methyl-5-hydroxy-6-metoxy-1,4-benzoquinol methylase
VSTERAYEGDELDLFKSARRWKTYWSSKVRPLLGKSVLEVGAGLGTNTPYLIGPRQEKWMCLEPDPALAGQILLNVTSAAKSTQLEVRVGTLNDLPPELLFDTLIYIDVLEHIENDGGELMRALSYLRPGGKIVVLSPAHPWLFTPFDAAIGHYRRYTKSSLAALTPAGASLQEIYYLDSVGLLAALANKLLLKQSMPSLAQILFWDKWLVTASRVLDLLIQFQLGKTLVGVWTKN